MTDDKHQDIRQAFERDYAAGEAQRDQANEDIRFVMTPGGMWDGFLEEAYANRPKMEYDMVVQSVDRFMGEWVSNELMPKFRAEDKDDQADAELLDGLFRARWRKEGGKQAAKNAVFEAITGGYGAIRIGTRYLDEFNAEDDRQEVTFTPIFSAHSTVVWDSDAKCIDKRDARHVSVLWEYTYDAFKRKWPDVTPVSAAGKDDRREFNWNNKHAIYVLEFYEKVKKRVKVHVFVNALGEKVTIEDADLELALPELIGYEKVAERKVAVEYVEKSMLTGTDYLEKPRRIAGKLLPIIPVYAYWAFVDGQEQYFGVVRKQKDPQRVLNMQISNLAEIAATSVKQAPIFAPEQVQGLEHRWAQAHLGKKNYQLARPLRNQDGTIAVTGPIGMINPPQIDPATQGLIQFSTDHIRSTSGGMPQDIEDPEASGKAILAVQKRVDLHTYTIMDNIASAMTRVGECFISIAQEIYTDNRTVTLITEEGAESRSQLNKIEVKDGQAVRTNDITQQRFEVYASVGPSYDSQRRETVEFLKELLQVLPEGDPRQAVIISSIIDNMHGVGLTLVKDFNRKQMLTMGIVEPEEGNEEEMQIVQQAQAQGEEPTPDMVYAQAEMKKAQVDEMEAQIKQGSLQVDAAEAETKRAKVMAEIERLAAQTAKTGYEIRGTELDNLQKMLQAMTPRSSGPQE